MLIETKYDIGQVVHVRLLKDLDKEVEATITAIWYNGKLTRYEIVYDKGRRGVPESSIIRAVEIDV